MQMSQVIGCPFCTVRLKLRDDAPAMLTCPRCLQSFANPTNATRPPMRVIPVEEDISRDMRGANRMVSLIGAGLIVVGFVLCLGSRAWGVGGVLILGGIIVCGMLPSILRARSRERQIEPRGPDYTPAPGDVLNYAPPSRRTHDTVWTIVRFVGGFFLGLAVCAGAIALLGSSYDTASEAGTKPLVLGAVAAAYVGVGIVASVSDYKGIFLGLGRGLCVGLLLGSMALGECALCYLG